MQRRVTCWASPRTRVFRTEKVLIHRRAVVRMIPNVAHFIWYGRALPWLNAMSIVSAARAGGFSRVVLHHGPELAVETLARLQTLPNLEARSIDPSRAFTRSEQSAALQALYARLTQPAARANLLRAAVLHAEGGVYLDMDTITLKPFGPLLSAEVFCGAEPIAFPSTLFEQPSLRGYARAHALNALREVLRLAPTGPRLFPRFAHLYTLAANNAVLAAQPEHPFVARLLAAMLELPVDKQLRRYALGTHLLQRTLRETAAQPASQTARAAQPVVHPQAVFYPLGPELSEHWFRLQHRIQLDEVLSPETYLIHWYASVRTRKWVQRMDLAFVQKHVQDQLLSRALSPYLDPSVP